MIRTLIKFLIVLTFSFGCVGCFSTTVTKAKLAAEIDARDPQGIYYVGTSHRHHIFALQDGSSDQSFRYVKIPEENMVVNNQLSPSRNRGEWRRVSFEMDSFAGEYEALFIHDTRTYYLEK